MPYADPDIQRAKQREQKRRMRLRRGMKPRSQGYVNPNDLPAEPYQRRVMRVCR